MEIKTSELSGAALDWCVMRALWPDIEPVIKIGPAFDEFPRTARIEYKGIWETQIVFMPSNDWRQCGPLIEKNQLCLEAGLGKDWVASAMTESPDGHPGWVARCGPTPLIAACRAIVYSRLGDTVTVPDELEGE